MQYETAYSGFPSLWRHICIHLPRTVNSLHPSSFSIIRADKNRQPEGKSLYALRVQHNCWRMKMYCCTHPSYSDISSFSINYAVREGVQWVSLTMKAYRCTPPSYIAPTTPFTLNRAVISLMYISCAAIIIQRTPVLLYSCKLTTIPFSIFRAEKNPHHEDKSL